MALANLTHWTHLQLVNTSINPSMDFTLVDQHARSNHNHHPQSSSSLSSVPLPLYRLHEGDVREAARVASCGQRIAADGAFAVAMVGAFSPLLEHRPDLYRRLHWEAGMVGQVLYLEAEARGLAGCGMGCFTDDIIHRDWLHWGSNGAVPNGDFTFQDLYHFAVGKRVEDPRLRTLDAYQGLVPPGSPLAQSTNT
jgi:hypothetical protein